MDIAPDERKYFYDWRPGLPLAIVFIGLFHLWHGRVAVSASPGSESTVSPAVIRREDAEKTAIVLFCAGRQFSIEIEGLAPACCKQSIHAIGIVAQIRYLDRPLGIEVSLAAQDIEKASIGFRSRRLKGLDSLDALPDIGMRRRAWIAVSGLQFHAMFR